MDDHLLAEFLTETLDLVNALDSKLVSFEENPNDANALAEIFRVVHTIKGTCGFLDLRRLEKIAHASESLLRIFQDSPEDVSSARVSLVLESLDCIKLILDGLANTGKEPQGDDTDLLSRLNDASAPAVVSSKRAEASGSEKEKEKEKPEPRAKDKTSDETSASSSDSPMPAVFKNSSGDSSNDISVPLLKNSLQDYAENSLAENSLAENSLAENSLAENSLAENSLAENSLAENSLEISTALGIDISSQWQGAATNMPMTQTDAPLASLRVRLDLIEQLMNSVSELVLSRNQLLQILRQNPSSEFSAPLQRLNQITSSLQEGVMKTRMQPIKNAWAPLPRLVRDLSKSTGKQVRLEMIGADTELDRQIIEMIRDPLIHIIRNAVDHGLESPEVREFRNKPQQGTITIKAYQEGGQVLIDVNDDGNGIDHEKIRNKIVDRRMMSEADAANLTVIQLHRFLFQSGFSTADKLTEVSGRGVGLDVVKTNIDKISGQIEMNSTLGAGSQIRIKIPLTLAIVSVLIARVGDQRYAFPQTSVVELVSFRESDDHKVSVLQGNLVLQLRDKILPLLSVRRLFDLAPLLAHHGSSLSQANNAVGKNGSASGTTQASEEATTSLSDIVVEALSPSRLAPELPTISPSAPSSAEIERRMLEEILRGDENYVVVMNVGTQQFGVLVEDIQDTEEIVVKPLSSSLRGTPFFSGNTILGDGRVILIIDPNSLSNHIGSDIEDSDIDIANESLQQLHESSVTLVMLNSGDGVKKVVPVSAINRLENIDCARIEYPSGRATVLYNDSLMPVMRIEEGRPLPSKGRHPVLVLSDGEKWAGIVVEEVLDIINEPLHIEVVGGERGIIGSAILREQSVEVLDMEYFWKRAFADSKTLPIDLVGATAEVKKPTRERRLLLVEKNRAFCDTIIPHLSSIGYRVFVADHIDQAIFYHKNDVSFDVVISDIDNDFEEVLSFVSRMRQMRDSWSTRPILALTASPPSEELTEACREAGFTDFLSKVDRADIVRCLKSLP